MTYINLKNETDLELLETIDVTAEMFDKSLETVKLAVESFRSISRRNEHYYRMGLTSESFLSSYPPYRSMQVKEKQEWKSIKDIKKGDRGVIGRGLLAILARSVPTIHKSIIAPRFQTRTMGDNTDPVELADELDVLLLINSIPGYFEYLEKLMFEKSSVFSGLRRGYLNFIEARAIHILTAFLKKNETNKEMLDFALFSEINQKKATDINRVLLKYIERLDPNHHDFISREIKNNLRSIYISFFNAMMTRLAEGQAIAPDMRSLLPVIPDAVSFIRSDLEAENAWNRYQEHHFLFMRVQGERKQKLMEKLNQMTPTEKVIWMGHLGKDEIRALILPMLSARQRFENLIQVCREINPEQTPDSQFATRVWDVMLSIYNNRLKQSSSTPESIHRLFGNENLNETDTPTKPLPDRSARDIKEEPDLNRLRELRFLVVDDSEKIRRMTTAVLKDVGITSILEAENGMKAWEIIQKEPLDVILCDWIMPELSGIELVQKMMQVERLANQTAFLMLTTVDDKSRIVEALSVGVRGYLIKPFTKKQMLEKVLFATEWLKKEQVEGKTPFKQKMN